MTYSDTGITQTDYVTYGLSWAREWPTHTLPGTLDADKVLTVFSDGYAPSGLVLGIVTATGRYAPYAGTTDEVQTITEGGSGLTSFTLTYSGQTTASIDDQATAAQVQAALEALSNIAVGDVTVTGDAGGPYTVTFGGSLANTNVAEMTATPTGGTGTVTIATATAGGADGASDGTQVAVGHLVSSVRVRAGKHVPIAIYYKGEVLEDRLPATSRLDPNAKTDLDQIVYSTVGA